jgi:hypothetical protein
MKPQSICDENEITNSVCLKFQSPNCGVAVAQKIADLLG